MPLGGPVFVGARATSSYGVFREFQDLFSADKPHMLPVIKTFESVHDLCGLPWWGTILAGGFLLRTVTCLPLHVLSEINFARVINTRPQMEELHEALKKKAVELKEMDVKNRRMKLKALVRTSIPFS